MVEPKGGTLRPAHQSALNDYNHDLRPTGASLTVSTNHGASGSAPGKP